MSSDWVRDPPPRPCWMSVRHCVTVVNRLFWRTLDVRHSFEGQKRKLLRLVHTLHISLVSGSAVGVKEALFWKLWLLSFTFFFCCTFPSFFFTLWPLCPLNLTILIPSASHYLVHFSLIFPISLSVAFYCFISTNPWPQLTKAMKLCCLCWVN